MKFKMDGIRLGRKERGDLNVEHNLKNEQVEMAKELEASTVEMFSPHILVGLNPATNRAWRERSTRHPSLKCVQQTHILLLKSSSE